LNTDAALSGIFIAQVPQHFKLSGLHFKAPCRLLDECSEWQGMEDLHTRSKAEVATQTHTTFCHTSFCHTFPERIWRLPTLSELISCCLLLQTAQMPQVVGTMGLAELDRWLDAADTAAYNDACRSFRSGKKHVAMESCASVTRERQAQHITEVGGAADRFAQYLMNFYYQV
jgi:hypothetical protein